MVPAADFPVMLLQLNLLQRKFLHQKSPQLKS